MTTCKYYHSTIRRIPRCSVCNGTGHNRTSCPELHACGPCGEPWWHRKDRATRPYDIAYTHGWNDAIDAYEPVKEEFTSLQNVLTRSRNLVKALQEIILNASNMEDLENQKDALMKNFQKETPTEDDIIYKAPASIYPVWHEKNPKNQQSEEQPKVDEFEEMDKNTKELNDLRQAHAKLLKKLKE